MTVAAYATTPQRTAPDMIDGVACTDCMFVVANADDSMVGPDWDAAAAEETMSNHWIYLNLPNNEDEEADLIDEFSTAECDVCGTTLMGTRHAIALEER